MNIELRNVSRRYGRVHALDDVSLRLPSGGIMAVLGLNGAGKTTLLRMLSAVIAPDRGDVLYDGVPLRRDDLATRRRFMFLPDFPLLFWDKTIPYNLSVILRLYGRDDGDAPQRAFELLRELDLLALTKVPVATLSRGQIHKTAMAALLLVDPDLWLMDEPLASGIDPLAISLLKREAKAAAARGRTVLYTTQLLDVAERFSDRILVLHEGRVRAFGTLDELGASSEDGMNPLEDLFRRLRDTNS